MSLQATPAHAVAGNISKQQAVEIATQKHPGRVLAVNKKDNKYRVKIINERGQVQFIHIDAKTGKVMPKAKPQQ